MCACVRACSLERLQGGLEVKAASARWVNLEMNGSANPKTTHTARWPTYILKKEATRLYCRNEAFCCTVVVMCNSSDKDFWFDPIPSKYKASITNANMILFIFYTFMAVTMRWLERSCGWFAFHCISSFFSTDVWNINKIISRTIKCLKQGYQSSNLYNWYLNWNL